MTGWGIPSDTWVPGHSGLYAPILISLFEPGNAQAAAAGTSEPTGV